MFSTLRQRSSRLCCSSSSSSAVSSISRRWMSDIAVPAGILTNLFSASTMPRVPLHQEFPGLPQRISTTSSQQSEEASVSTLSNGVRVVTLPSNNVAIGSVGVFVEAGSRYEDSRTTGLTHFMELMAFKSTKNRSDFRLVRDMLKIGANITAAASREHLVLTGDALKQYLPHVLGALADVIQNSAFHPHEIVAVKEKYELDYVNRLSTPDIKMMEAIQEAAYFNNTLGNPLYASVHQLNNFNSEVLQNFGHQFFTAPRIVVAAVGVEHEDMKQLTQHLFSGLSSESRLVKAKSQYTGGECRMHFRGLPTAHLAIAFETASWGDNDVVPMCVLQMLMGGGGSFSAGGPGKGMYSRLYTNVLNKHEFVESATSFNSIYSDSSLFGLYGVAEHRSASKLADVLIREALRMAGPVDAVELLRAKNALKSAMLIQLEHRNVRLEDIGKQLSTLGKITSVSEVCKRIDAVTAEDVQRVAKKMLATNPAVAAYGDLAFVPRYDTIQKAFK